MNTILQFQAVALLVASATTGALGGCSSSTKSSAPADGAADVAATDAASSEVNTADVAVGDASDGSLTDDATDAASDSPDAFLSEASVASLVAARPYSTKVPSGYDASKPTPFILLLHGYSATGALQFAYMGLDAFADAQTVIVAYPDGLKDPTGNQYWNATDACCDLYKYPVDDVAYLTAVMDDVQAHYNVDPKQIFVIGHSNGAFMAQRLACERAGKIAAIASLAGAQWNDITKCGTPAAPISVVDIHGNADMTISYTGSTIEQNDGTVVPYPSEATTIGDWATFENCTGALTMTSTTLDIDQGIPGNETTVQKYASCTGADVQLWTIDGGAHIPDLGASFATYVWGFFALHPLP